MRWWTWRLGLLVLLVALTPGSHAQEVATLSSAVKASAGLTTVRPARLVLDVEQGLVQIVVKQWANGAFVATRPVLEVTYDGGTMPTGRSLIIALNKANLSAKTLERRLLEQLVASGHLPAATYSGTPE